MDSKLIYAALESMPNFIIVDHKGLIVYINRIYSELLGVSPEEVIGKPVQDVIPNTKLMEVLSAGKAMTGDIMTFYHHKTQQQIDLVCNRLPLFEDGKIIGAAAITTFETLSDLSHLYAELDRIKKENEQYKQKLRQIKDNPLSKVIGSSPAMVEIKQTIADFAKSNLTILLTGETGVGKEVFATAIHELSPRKLNAFVKINCAAIPKDLLESELFGYEEGAFTGAKKHGKPGKFELADNGTLLLDEIGEMPIDLQSKLLRVLQEREIERLGSTKSKKINVRLICSTNRDVVQLVKEGKFREDLYYRINTVELAIPPLRDRLSDLPALCSFFIQKNNEEYGFHTRGIDRDVLALFERYSWPGNIRELQHTIERLSFLNQDTVISMRHCAFLEKKMAADPDLAVTLTNDLHINRDQADMESIRKALREADGNRTKAAKLLGISRSMLYNKLKQYDIK